MLGRLNHVALAVPDIAAASAHYREALGAPAGAHSPGVQCGGDVGFDLRRVLGDGEPKIGAHGKPVLFLHPKDFFGTLVELEQV